MPINTVQLLIEVHDGSASIAEVNLPPGIALEAEIRDFDVSPDDFFNDSLPEDEDGMKYYVSNDIRSAPADTVTMTALDAIIARIQGEFDHPALVEYGPLGTDTLADILAIARHERRLAPKE